MLTLMGPSLVVIGTLTAQHQQHQTLLLLLLMLHSLMIALLLLQSLLTLQRHPQRLQCASPRHRMHVLQQHLQTPLHPYIPTAPQRKQLSQSPRHLAVTQSPANGMHVVPPGELA